MTTRRKRSGTLPLIIGLWCTFFAAYAQIACDPPTTGVVGPGEDADVEDDASDASASDATSDASEDAAADSSDDAGSEFDDSAGSYANDNTGCGLEDFVITLDGDDVIANPFGTNGAVKFVLKAGSLNIVEANNLNIFQLGGHYCSITETEEGKLKVDCSNTQGGSCTEGYTKQQ